MDDNAQQPSTGGDTKTEFDSKNIKRVDNKKLFTNVKQPSKRVPFRTRVANFFKPIKNFFGNIFKFFKDHRFARIALIVLIIAIPLGVWVLVKTVFPGDIMIGDIRITRQEINTYADELDRYKEVNPTVIMDDAVQTATDFLVENAAFRHFAQTDCANVDIDFSEVRARHPDQNTFYLRIPFENEEYRKQLADCLIFTRTIFSVSTSFVTPYFNSIEDTVNLEAAFVAARQQLDDNFLPLFEQDLSMEDIAAKSDVDLVLNGWSEKPLELMDVRAFTIAGSAICKGEVPHCFNDRDDIDFDIADPGPLYSTSEKIQSLKEIGDYTDVFASKAGAFTILRLEDRGGLFDNYDAMLEHIHQTYVKKNFFARLFAFVVGKVFTSEDAYASTRVVDIAKIGGICGPGSDIGTSNGHTVEFYVRAQTTAGLPLDGWEINVTQTSNCIKESPYSAVLSPGPYDSEPPVLLFRTNCYGGGPNFTTSNGRANLNPDDLVVTNPAGYSKAEYLVWRNSNNESSVPVLNPPAANKNKPIPWTPVEINQRYEGNGIIIVYEGKPIEAAFSAQSAVSIGASHSGYDISGVNGNKENGDGARAVERTVQNVVNGVAPQVTVNFDHIINYRGPIPSDAWLPLPPPASCNVAGSTTRPCTNWTVESDGDISTGLPTNGIADALSIVREDNQSGVFLITYVRQTTITVTLPVPARGTSRTVEICERNKFNIGQWIPIAPASNSFNAVAGTNNSSTACAVFIVSNDGPDVYIPTDPSGCPIPGDLTGPDRGNTRARSGVVNLSRNNAWLYTNGTDDNTKSVWAKPGDNIRFSHTLCFGAQSVRGSRDPAPASMNRPEGERPTNPRETTPPFSYRTQFPNSFNANAVNTFTVKASTLVNGSELFGAANGNYLFGKTLANPTGETFSRILTAGQSRPLSGVADISNDYNFTFFSPSNNANDTFRCYDPERGLPSFQTNSYQIPGFNATNVPANCGPYTTNPKVSPTASDAGKTIVQKLDWRNVQAWINTSSGSPQGSCGCASTRSTQKRALAYGDGPVAGFSTGFHRYDCYECGCCGEECESSSYCDLYNHWYYPMSVNVYEPGSAQAPTQTVQVKIPYNYTTAPRASITAFPVVFGGTDIDVSASVKINPRPNTEVSSTPYATISKPSVYEVVVFTVESVDADYDTAIKHEDSLVSGNRDKHACTYYRTFGTRVNNCQTLTRDERTFNPKGIQTETPQQPITPDIVFNNSITVPDLPAGAKFCVAVGVWPGDSHDNHTDYSTTPGNPDTPDGSGGIALNNSGNYWHYSEPTCRSIAKKPTVQFQSSGVYTNGGITTSQTKKHATNPAYNINSQNISHLPSGDSQLISSKINGSQRRVFGSLSEYEAIARDYISGLASGAAFGYNRNNSGNLTNPAATSVRPPADFFGLSYNATPELCTYSTQTFNNTNCASNREVGYSLINSMGPTVLDRLISRYTLPDDVLTSTTGSPDTVTDIAYWGAPPISGYCKPKPDGSFIPVFPNGVPHSNPAFTCLNNGAKYIKIQGDAKMGNHSDGSSVTSFCVGQNEYEGVLYPFEGQNRTIVLHVTGKFTLNGNLMLDNTLGSNSRGPFCGTPLTFSGIADIPQFIIFAGDIDISWSVQHIDAWLIAGKSGTTGSGTIDTCYSANFDDLTTSTYNDHNIICGRIYLPTTPALLADAQYMAEWNGTLTINGPVFANRLNLNRISGSEPGSESIVPAEIFNLPASSYLWSYNQAQRFSQAVTTYSRELAPRY